MGKMRMDKLSLVTVMVVIVVIGNHKMGRGNSTSYGKRGMAIEVLHL